MKIESTGLQYVDVTRGGTRKYVSAATANPLQEKRTATQKVSLQPGSTVDLGKINGKPFDFHLFEDSGFEWSGAVRLYVGSGGPEPGSRVTPEQEAAAQAMNRYSEDEWKRGDGIAGVVFSLYNIASGRLSLEAFNEGLQKGFYKPEHLQEALSRLGIDSREPFEINGSTYTLQQGRLYQVVNESA